MRILIVSYMDLSGPGTIQAYNYANMLAKLGCQVMFLFPGDINTVKYMDTPPAFEIDQVVITQARLSKSLTNKIRNFYPKIIHVWTPRTIPALVALQTLEVCDSKLIIHHEDHEDYLYQQQGVDVFADKRYFLDSLVNPERYPWKHPVISYVAERLADGFTCICKPLYERLKEQWNKPTHLLYPIIDFSKYSLESNHKLFKNLGLSDKMVLLYTGSVAGFHDFDLVLQGFAKAAQRCPGLHLLHIGKIHIEQSIDQLIKYLKIKDRVTLLGKLPNRLIPHFLASADILVQGGRDNPFNRYRLPAKLPEYMAAGKPIITFATGFGEELADKKDVLKTYTDDPSELAECIVQLVNDKKLGEQLGENAKKKAEVLFDPMKNTKSILDFYQHILKTEAADGAMKPVPLSDYLPLDIIEERLRFNNDVQRSRKMLYEQLLAREYLVRAKDIHISNLEKALGKVKRTPFYKTYSILKRIKERFS